MRRPPFTVQSDFLVIKLCWLVHPLRIWGRLESPALRRFFSFLYHDVPWALVVVGLMTDIPFRGEHCPLFSAFWPITPSSMDFCLPQKEAFMIQVEDSFNLLEVYWYKHEYLEGMLITWPFSKKIIADFAPGPMAFLVIHELLTWVQGIKFLPVEQTSNPIRKWLACNSYAIIAQVGISSLSC